MSFSNDVKNEIIANKPLRLRYKIAQAYGLLLYAKAFSEKEISLHTESRELADLYKWFIHVIADRPIQVNNKERLLRGKHIFQVSIPSGNDRKEIVEKLFSQGMEECQQGPEHEHAFLSGAWLACGNITDPQKSYHMEFVCRDEQLCSKLEMALNRHSKGARRTLRRGMHVLYFKECSEIEDLLAIIGASKSSLAMIEVEIIKNVRNKANRVTNCETANIDKLVSASAAQIEDIQLIAARKGLGWLPDNLRVVAEMRIENPDMSLRELADSSPTPISRSGMHHRLDKLSKLAQQLRETETGEDYDV